MSKHGKRHGKTRPPAPPEHAPEAQAPESLGAEAAADGHAPDAAAESTASADKAAPAPAATAATPAPAPAAPASRTAGQMLRAMREEAGVDAALVASGMKVSLQKIQALEEDRFEDLPDLTFARGLASAISRAFGMDPAPVLERMPVPATGLRAPSPGLNQPFRSNEPSPALMSAASGIPKPVWWGAAALVLGALALWLLPPLPIQLNAPVAQDGAPATSAGAGMVQESVPVPAPGSGEPANAAATGSEAAASSPAAAAAVTDAASATAAAAAAPAASAASASAAASAPDSTAGKLLAFTATGESWVAVRDAAGRQILNRTLSAGDSVGVSGETPLSVTVGRKEAVSVTVRGEPFSLRGTGNASVARFQVN